MSEFFQIDSGQVLIEAAPVVEFFQIEAGDAQLLSLAGPLVEVSSLAVDIIEAAITETLVVESPQVEFFEVGIQGPPGAKGEPADTNIIQAAVAGNATQVIDRVPVIGFWAAQWLITADQDSGDPETLSRRSYIVNATLNTADVDVVKYGNRGQPVAFVSRVIIEGSDVVLQIENRSASPLNFRIIRLETRF